MSFLRGTCIVGWASGLVLLDKPWGIPRFTSWFSASPLISLGMLFIVFFLTIDMIINYSDFAEQAETTRLGIYIAKISSTHQILFYFITRFTFLLNAKTFSNVFTRLYYYPMKNGNVLSRKLKAFDCVVILLSHICSIIIVCNSTFIVIQAIENQENYILDSIGPIGYGVIVAVFGMLPVCLSDTICFAFVIALIRAILRIYNEFCDDLETFLLKQPVLNGDLRITNKKSLSYAGNLADFEREFKRFVHFKLPAKANKNTSTEKIVTGNNEIVSYPQTRDEIVCRFFDMVDIFDCAGKILYTFVFVILVVTTVQLVATVSVVVVIGHRGVFLALDIVTLVKVAVHMCLLQVGHRIQVSLTKGKNQVRRAFIDSSMRRDMRDIVTAVSSWDWKLSGLGFFDVDRKLAAGTISLLLSYVVIIFQLQLALSPSTHSDLQ